jgi:two-component system phosphate regulon sensor histidine kinase PhoR
MDSDLNQSKNNNVISKIYQRLWLRLKMLQGVLVVAILLLIYFGLIGKVSIWLMLICIVALIISAVSIFNPFRFEEEQARFLNSHQNSKVSSAALGAASSAKALIDAIDAPIFVIDKNYKILHCNGVAENIFSGATLGSYFNMQFRNPEFLAAIDEVVKSGRNQRLEYQTHNPSENWYLVEIAPISKFSIYKTGDSNEYNQEQDYFIIFRDITQMHAVEQMRSDFIANASHELRTPLASVSGYIDTLLGAARNDETAREQFLQIMQKDTARMSRLIDDLLSLSRIEMQRNVVYTNRVDLQQVLQQVIGTLKPVAKGFDVKINFKNDKQLYEVLGEYDALVQVFQNLIENACKYGQSGGKVDVKIRRVEVGESLSTSADYDEAKSYIVVSVQDYGSGIAEHHLPRLTERFYRVSVEASRAHKGTGLGLAIVKHILNQHRADLDITSEMGKGSCFKVIFQQKI